MLYILLPIVAVTYFFLGMTYQRRKNTREINEFREKMFKAREEGTTSMLDIIMDNIKVANVLSIVERNNGRIPDKEAYDIIYNHYVEEGKFECPCGGEEECNVRKSLLGFRKSHPELFTQEELNRNDGL